MKRAMGKVISGMVCLALGVVGCDSTPDKDCRDIPANFPVMSTPSESSLVIERIFNKTPAEERSLSITNAEDCERANGVWGFRGALGQKICNLRATDAGKRCYSSEECEGDCFVRCLDAKCALDKVEGYCSAFVINKNGCFSFYEKEDIERGVIRTVCFD